MSKVPDYKSLPYDKGIITWMVILHALAAVAFFLPFEMNYLYTVILFYFLTGCIGITLGYHRLLSHRSFEAPLWVRRVCATFGTLSLQGSPIEWVGTHRLHHSFSDTDKDPHNAEHGFWYSHWGWLFRDQPMRKLSHLKKFSRDIVADPYMMWLDKIWVQIGMQVVLGLTLWATLGFAYMIWGIFVRIAVVYHFTWFINSATHKWGNIRYETNDTSKNIWWVALTTWGEGWHNNHHAHPNVAPAGHRWYEIDITYYIIKLMEVFGLAYNVNKVDSIKNLVGTQGGVGSDATEKKASESIARPTIPASAH